MKIQLKNVRITFPQLFERGNYNGSDTGYNARFLLDKTEHKEQIQKVISVIKQLQEEKNIKIPTKDICLKDGQEKFDEKGWAGHDNAYYIHAKNADMPPLVIDRDRTKLTKETSPIYAGCYVNVIVDMYLINNKFGKWIVAKLLGVQFVEEGEPLANDVARATEFEELEVPSDKDDIDFLSDL